MTAAPGMRDLAHRLLVYEAGVGKASEPLEFPTLRVYEKLRQSLGGFVGVAGFYSLASRLGVGQAGSSQSERGAGLWGWCITGPERD